MGTKIVKNSARLSIGRRAKRSRFSEDAREFLSWWGKTLVSMLPSGLVNAYSTRRQSIYVWRDGDSFSAGRPDKHDLGNISEKQSLRRRVAASDPVLLLQPGDVLIRKRRLPVASINRLSHAMRLQLAADTPFNMDEIYTSVRTVGTPDSDGNIEVEQAIVKREVADALVAELSAMEIDLAGADMVGADGLPCGFNLLPDDQCARQGAFLPTVNRVLSFAAVALAVALGTSYYIDLSREAVTLEQSAEASGQVAREVLALQAEAQAGVAAIEQISAQTNNPGRFAAAYAAVTDALDDETWLEGLTYTGNSFSLIGLTAESEKLISVLEASPQIASARFSASVVTDRRHEAERFRIEVQFKGGDENQDLALMEDRG